MILRLWSGWTPDQDAAARYDAVLDGDVAPGIVGRRISGLERFEVWTRREAEEDGEHEFLTAMWFTDLDAVATFTGGDPSTSVVPPQARGILGRFDTHSRHYELRRRHI